jgi:hypothetical protein
LEGDKGMAFYRITYGCGCGDNEEYMIFNSQQEADKAAYQLAIEDYESFEGLHGIRSMREIAEEDFDLDFDELDYNTADWIDVETTYFDERESQISYGAEEISEEEYKEYMEDMK